MIKHYIKKPCPIKVIQWNGDNFDEIKEFCEDVILGYDYKLIIPIIKDGKFVTSKYVAEIFDYLIKDESNEFYFCDKDIFEKTYEVV